MKNTDDIAKSEAEWLRNKYENMTVCENMHRLYDSVKRSTRKCIRRMAVNVYYSRRNEIFSPSYDEKKENIVISLTSIPVRIRHIFPTLYSLIRQTCKPDLIVLWLGDKGDFPQKIISKIEDMGVMVKYRADIGAHTKYHYAFREYKKDLVITVDDDIIYHEKMIEELYRTFLKHPDMVIARRVHKIRFGYSKKPFRYMEWIWEYTGSESPSYDLFATGAGGVLYPPEVMASKCWENKDFIRISLRADDIWLKFCELSEGIRVCAVTNPGFRYDVVKYGTQKVSLAAENVVKRKNDEIMRSCAEYFGMRDDLYDRIFSQV